MPRSLTVFTEKLFEVVYEDSDLFVVNKPAGLVCHPTKTDEYSSLISRARLYLGSESHPQLINRLDRETSGLVVISKLDSVARQLRQLWEARTVTKEYLAIVHGLVQVGYGLISEPLGKDERSIVAIKDSVRPDGAPASTEFWVKQTFHRPTTHAVEPPPAEIAKTRGTAEFQEASFSLLRVVPHTGRKHQIRIHLAHAGHPIVGDKLYGGDEDLYLALVEDRLTAEQRARLILPHHALHAAELRFDWAGVEKIFRAEPEPWFKAFCSVAVEPA